MKDDDEIIGHRGKGRPLVPDDEYTAIYAHKEMGEFKGRKRLYLHFRIIKHTTYQNFYLFHSCPFPKDGSDSFGDGSNLIKALTVALDGKRPPKGSPLALKPLKGKWFRVQTRTVTTDSDGKPLHADDYYSVVDRLLSYEPDPDPGHKKWAAKMAEEQKNKMKVAEEGKNS